MVCCWKLWEEKQILIKRCLRFLLYSKKLKALGEADVLQVVLCSPFWTSPTSSEPTLCLSTNKFCFISFSVISTPTFTSSLSSFKSACRRIYRLWARQQVLRKSCRYAWESPWVCVKSHRFLSLLHTYTSLMSWFTAWTCFSFNAKFWVLFDFAFTGSFGPAELFSFW